MNPAGEEFVRSSIAHQGALLGHQASQLSSTAQEVETLTAQVAELSGRFRALQQDVLLIIIIIHYIYIALFKALKALYIQGGISSTTTNVQHPPG